MKYVLYGVLALLSFAGSMVLALALTGNLNKEALDRLMQKEPEMSVPAPSPTDTIGPLTQQIKKKEEQLKQREQELSERESQLNQREAGLKQLQTQLEGIQKEISGTLESAEAERNLRVQTVALTLAQMKPDKAAKSLESMPVEDVAAILAQVKDKDRGKIVEAMDPQTATKVLRALQESKLPGPAISAAP
jgi:flagellar motility protein MotE (MotC chaperone)